MNTAVLYLVSLLVRILPETKFFSFKRRLYCFAGMKIGKNVHICSSVRFLGNGKIEIGDNTWIGHNVLIISSSLVKIGDNVDIAPSVYIGTGSHKINCNGERVAGEGYSASITIENGCWICVNATILPGCTIGGHSLIGAGAVVITNVSRYTMVGGVPAKVIKNLYNDYSK